MPKGWNIFNDLAIKGIFALFLLLNVLSLLFSPVPVLAKPETPAYEQAKNFFTTIGVKSNLDSTKGGNVPSGYAVVGGVINMIIAFLGIWFFATIIWAGYRWMTAGGKEEQVSNAITILKQAIIGLSVVILAYLFVNYIMLKAIEILILNQKN